MRLIGIAGASKRSGKSTAGNFIFANELKNLGIIERFEMDEEGKLYVNHSAYEDEVNKIDAGMAELNMECRDAPFLQFLSQAIWPHVKIYSFADLLKFISINMYGLTEPQVYGNTKEKESETPYTYKQLKKIVPGKYFPKTILNLDDKVIARKFVQYLGDTLRELNDDCFLAPVMRQIEIEQVPLSLICDVRRVVEVQKIQEAGGKVIFLNRSVEKDTHRIENEFNDIDKSSFFDIVIESQDMTIAQKNLEIATELKSIGWL
jgi:hypothetical protein